MNNRQKPLIIISFYSKKISKKYFGGWDGWREIGDKWWRAERKGAGRQAERRRIIRQSVADDSVERRKLLLQPDLAQALIQVLPGGCIGISLWMFCIDTAG